MKVNFFDHNASPELLNVFVKDKIIVKIRSIKNLIAIYYVERKVVNVDCSKLTRKQKETFVEILPKLKFLNDNDVTIDYKMTGEE